MINLNIVGQIDYSKKVYKCFQCKFPILKYGRILPCKHFYCETCTMNIGSVAGKLCPRCGEQVKKYTVSNMQKVFVCHIKESNGSECLKGYFCQEDLTAHVNTRHKVNV